MPLLALRLAQPSVLVDINRVPGLDAIATRPGGGLRIGALARHRALAAQDEHPLLAEAARWIGHAAIRTRGTLGGSLAHADPAAELPVVAAASGAVALVAGPDGRREVPAADLFAGALQTSLHDDELIEAVEFPPRPGGASPSSPGGTVTSAWSSWRSPKWTGACGWPSAGSRPPRSVRPPLKPSWPTAG